MILIETCEVCEQNYLRLFRKVHKFPEGIKLHYFRHGVHHYNYDKKYKAVCKKCLEYEETKVQQKAIEEQRSLQVTARETARLRSLLQNWIDNAPLLDDSSTQVQSIKLQQELWYVSFDKLLEIVQSALKSMSIYEKDNNGLPKKYNDLLLSRDYIPLSCNQRWMEYHGDIFRLADGRIAIVRKPPLDYTHTYMDDLP